VARGKKNVKITFFAWLYNTNLPRELYQFLKVLDQLKKEHELTKQMISTLSSFRVDPSLAAAAAGSDRYLRKKEDENAKRDPDVWPPPTPQEPR